jgi:putative oxidoreductase
MSGKKGIDSFLTGWAPRLQSLFRIVAAFLFIQHGGQKLFGFPIASQNPPDLLSLIGLAGILEFFGGLLLLLGLFTRPVAFLLSGLMAFAYFIAHVPRGFWPIANGGELAALYCFAFLYLAAAGGGTWSLDKLRGQS